MSISESEHTGYYEEDDLLAISGLQHLRFCERQWALIHIEQVWNENRFTAEGRVMHERAHSGDSESRSGLRIARSLRLRSLKLGLSGVADIVEFHRVTPEAPTYGTAVLPGRRGRWRPVPVEYKRGRKKKNSCDKVQLCAQAICLEEMLDVYIPAGFLFYGKEKRRTEIIFDEQLRNETTELTLRMHTLFKEGVTPSATYGKYCDSCSLLEICMPKKSNHASAYIANTLSKILGGEL